MNDDRRSTLDNVRGRIDWIDGSIKYDRLSDPYFLEIYLDDLEYARKCVDTILQDEEYSYENMRGPSDNVLESSCAQEDLRIALKEFDILIAKVKTFKEKYSTELSREYNEENKEERDKIAIKLRRLMKRYTLRIEEHLSPYSLVPMVKNDVLHKHSE